MFVSDHVVEDFQSLQTKLVAATVCDSLQVIEHLFVLAHFKEEVSKLLVSDVVVGEANLIDVVFIELE